MSADALNYTLDFLADVTHYGVRPAPPYWDEAFLDALLIVAFTCGLPHGLEGAFRHLLAESHRHTYKEHFGERPFLGPT